MEKHLSRDENRMDKQATHTAMVNVHVLNIAVGANTCISVL
jgi:hypothetical protein